MSNRSKLVKWLVVMVLVALAVMVIWYRSGRPEPRPESVVELPAITEVNTIDFSEAPAHIGEERWVRGEIDHVFAHSDGHYFLNFCADYRECPFSSPIFADALGSFDRAPTDWSGREVFIFGRITTYQGRPQIIIEQPEQIKVEPESPAGESEYNEVGYRVVKVVDGDTIKVEINGGTESVRLIGLDAPEIDGPYSEEECYGPEAKNKLTELLADGRVILEANDIRPDRDHYDRLLRYVYLPTGELINARLIAGGYAFAYTTEEFEQLQHFVDLEQQAREYRRGLWSQVCDYYFEFRSEIIGRSVEDRAIRAHHFGRGADSVFLIGGIHGGYEWNSTALMYNFIDYLQAEPELVPENLTVTIIPTLNPDGLFAAVGTDGRFEPESAPSADSVSETRFNARGVDLNRNFDCRWQPESYWSGEVVSAGTRPFSEPEAETLRFLVEDDPPRAVLFYHSAAKAVYGSECGEGLLPETADILELYSEAAGYPAVPTFDHYEVTGAADDWLASIGVPALTVELSDHRSLDWPQNQAGLSALLEYYR